MSQKYKAKQRAGREYVDATKEFTQYTTDRLLKLPAKWKDYLLDPIFDASSFIRKQVIRVNKVYINKNSQSNEEQLTAYRERVNYLIEAVREFAVFDDAFEQMLFQIDFLHDETKRMKSVLQHLIEEEQMQHTYDGEVKLNISVRMRLDEIEYTTVLGNKRMIIGLTNRNKDYWLDLEEKALTEIKDRIKKDNVVIKSLTNSA